MRLHPFRYLLILVTAAVMAGCVSQAEKPDANYAAYLELIKTQAAQQDEQRTAFAQMAAKCTTDACVSQVAAIAALAGANGSHTVPPQQYVQRESMAAKVGLALVSQLSPLAAAAVSWHSTDASKDVSIAQFGFLGGATHDLTNAAVSLGQVAGTLPPSITVGHDYVSGSVDNGLHIGGDQVGQDKVGGDKIAGDRVDNSGVINSGTIERYQSPGPYDDHSASGTGCTGSETCQTQPPPATPP